MIPARNQSHFIITVVNINKNKRGREERKKKKEMKYLECLVSLPLNLVLSPLSFQGQYSAHQMSVGGERGKEKTT